MRIKGFVLFVVLCMGLLAACAPGERTQDAMMEPTPTGAMMEEQVPQTGADDMMEATAAPEMMEETSDPMMEGTSKPGMMEETTDPMMETAGTPEMMEEQDTMMAPKWFAAPLTDEGSGETFKIEDFAGKVVLVETFAQWCPTCLRQQNEMVKLHEMLGMRDDLVTVSLDVDPNEDAAMLKKYLEKHGFEWRYAIAPAETAREIGSLYGEQFLNPPSAPMLIIDRRGEAHPLPFGVKSAEDLQAALKPFLEDGM